VSRSSIVPFVPTPELRLEPGTSETHVSPVREEASSRGRRLRILQAVETLDVGGVERLAIQLAEAEQQRGHACSILCVFHEGAMAQEARGRGIQVYALDKKRGPSPASLLRLVQLFSKLRPDVVHTHNSGIHHYAAVAARLAAVPVVVNTRHSPPVAALMKRERHYKWAMRLTDTAVFVSEPTRKAVLATLAMPEFKSGMILNGIPTGLYRGGRRWAPGAQMPRITFGTVGRLEPVKGHDILIEAFAQVLKVMPDARLRIIGGGPLAGYLKEVCQRHMVEHAVSLEGPTRTPQDVYRELDCFVISSHSEGLPLALLEAMASGLPVIATRVGGIPSVVNDEVGLLCEPGDARSLAEAMLATAHSSDLPARGSRAALRAVAQFDIDVMCSQYLDLFHSLIANR
jgi:glycosyltransferase involved in cell wall biosynthesis